MWKRCYLAYLRFTHVEQYREAIKLPSIGYPYMTYLSRKPCFRSDHPKTFKYTMTNYKGDDGKTLLLKISGLPKLCEPDVEENLLSFKDCSPKSSSQRLVSDENNEAKTEFCLKHYKPGKSRQGILPADLLQKVTTTIQQQCVNQKRRSSPAEPHTGQLCETDLSFDRGKIDLDKSDGNKYADKNDELTTSLLGCRNVSTSLIKKSEERESSCNHDKCEGDVPAITQGEDLPSHASVSDSSVGEITKGPRCEAFVKEESIEDEVYDISCLFSAKSDTAYKKSEKIKQKKGRKRKREIEAEDDGASENLRPKKKPANYFVAIQITNKKIHEALEEVRQCVIEQEPMLQAALVPLATLHLTMMVMHLEDEEGIQKAKRALEMCREKLGIALSDPVEMTISGLGNFRDNVVFAQVQPGEELDHLNTIAETVASCFGTENILPSDKKGFKPHATIMKLSRAPGLKKKGIKKINSALYAEYADDYFGKQLVESLQLCAMMKKKDEAGYYYVEHEVPLATEMSQVEWDKTSLDFTNKSHSPLSTHSRSLATYAITSAIDEMTSKREMKQRENEEELEDSGHLFNFSRRSDSPVSETSRTLAKQAIRTAFTDLRKERREFAKRKAVCLDRTLVDINKRRKTQKPKQTDEVFQSDFVSSSNTYPDRPGRAYKDLFKTEVHWKFTCDSHQEADKN